MNNKVKELPKNRQTDTAMSEKKGGAGIFIPIDFLKDKRLSPKAKGLFCIILSQPKNWVISLDALAATSYQLGKKAVQSGIKELAQNGYVVLTPMYDENGKFRGRNYKVVERVRQSSGQSPFGSVLKRGCPASKTEHFGTVLKQDEPKTELSIKKPPNTLKINGQHPFRSILKADSPKRVSTRSVVVDLENINKQQQQIKDDTKTGLSVTHYYPTLLQDAVWKGAFVGQLLSDQSALTTAQFDILLQHFKQTSLRSGALYGSAAAVKKHFLNWYNLHFDKQSLVTYIKQHHLTVRNARKRVFDLVQHSENIFSKLKQRAYASEAEVLRAVAALQKHQTTYEAYLLTLSEGDDKVFLEVLLADIETMKGKAEKAKQQGKLSWFCG